MIRKLSIIHTLSEKNYFKTHISFKAGRRVSCMTQEEEKDKNKQFIILKYQRIIKI